MQPAAYQIISFHRLILFISWFTDQPATATASAQAQQRPSSTPQDLPLKPNTELSKETIKPGVGINPSKPRTSAAIQLNLASDSESCGVSAGEDGSDEDDFDFYDKL